MVAKKYFISPFVCSLFLISRAQDNYGIIQYIKDSIRMKKSVSNTKYWRELYNDEKLNEVIELGVVTTIEDVPNLVQSDSIIKKRHTEQIETEDPTEDDKDRLNEYINNHDDYRLKKWFEDLKKKKGTFDSKEENQLKSAKLKQKQP
ncbi:hypothetical protein BDF21DRAFT_452329 [Thamnidium elegans]|nr:hypothetical protein BDF21DRAFT_452329 [Thamnidium elegans]